MTTTAPVIALTFIGAIVAVLGFFAGSQIYVVIGLLSIFGAGVLQTLMTRRKQ